MSTPYAPGRTDVIRQWLAFAVLSAVGIAIYTNIFAAPFVFDSVSRIRENVHIRQLWPPWGWLTYGQRPIAYFTIALNYALHDYQLWGYHAVNLTIHLLASCVLFLLVQRTFRRVGLTRRDRGSMMAPAFAVALLWLTHPLHTQAVTYTIQRIESLMGLFYLLTLYCFSRAEHSSRASLWLVASSCCCWLGMATKEVMVSAPLIVLWYDRVFIANKWRDIWASRRWYYASLFASWLLLAFLVTQMGDYGQSAIKVDGVTPLDYAMSQPGVILHYLRLCFWPIGQNLDYGWQVPQSLSAAVLPALGVAMLVAATVWCIFRRPQMGFLGGWFFLILAPTSSVMPIVDLAFEHRMYLPLAAVCTLAVVAVRGVLHRLHALLPVSPRWCTLSSWVALWLLVGTLGGLSHLRNEVYRSELLLWADVIKKSPHHLRGYANLGARLIRVGRIDEAIPYLQHVLAKDPRHLGARNNLARSLIHQGHLQAAIEHAEIAIAQDPTAAEAYEILGAALALKHQSDGAIQALRKAISLDPQLAIAHVNLGTLLEQKGEIDAAIHHFEAAIRLDPYNASAFYNFGAALYERGQIDDAMQHFRDAIRLNPDLRPAINNLKSRFKGPTHTLAPPHRQMSSK
jgi:Tfp pilus assembly protein PilF